VNALLISDEAHFRMCGYVNKQNCHYWAPNNPCELHQCPQHSAKVTMWCAVSFENINGPCFFENVEEHAITVMLETFLQNELCHCQLDSLWFQQDGASAHTTDFHGSSQDDVSRQTHFSF